MFCVERSPICCLFIKQIFIEDLLCPFCSRCLKLQLLNYGLVYVVWSMSAKQYSASMFKCIGLWSPLSRQQRGRKLVLLRAPPMDVGVCFTTSTLLMEPSSTLHLRSLQTAWALKRAKLWGMNSYHICWTTGGCPGLLLLGQPEEQLKSFLVLLLKWLLHPVQILPGLLLAHRKEGGVSSSMGVVASPCLSSWAT